MFGLCGVVYYMLHGEPMQLEQKDGKWAPKLPFRKYWQYTLWEKLFDTLLNVKDCNSIPSLKDLRAMFEDYLASNPKKAASLKAMLCKQSVSLYDSTMKK
jgi:checkpoint serine/threonine-protein kinase